MDSLDDIEERLEAPRWEVRKKAVKQLAAIENKRKAVKLLIKRTEDKAWEVRREACRILGDIGHKSAVPALVNALGDEDFEVRYASIVALRDFKDIRAVRALSEILENIRTGTVRVYGLPYDPIYVNLAIGVLNFKPETVKLETRIYAFLLANEPENIVKIGKEAVPTLIDALATHDDLFFKNNAIPALIKILSEDEGSGRDIVVRPLKGRSHREKTLNCRTLGEMLEVGGKRSHVSMVIRSMLKFLSSEDFVKEAEGNTNRYIRLIEGLGRLMKEIEELGYDGKLSEGTVKPPKRKAEAKKVFVRRAVS